eukprot:3066140-Pyramimonas_sp.AAC.1
MEPLCRTVSPSLGICLQRARQAFRAASKRWLSSETYEPSASNQAPSSFTAGCQAGSAPVAGAAPCGR